MIKALWKKAKRYLVDWRIIINTFKPKDELHYDLWSEEEVLHALQNKILVQYYESGFVESRPPCFADIMWKLYKEGSEYNLLYHRLTFENKDKAEQMRLRVAEIVATALDIARFCDIVMRGEGPEVQEPLVKGLKQLRKKGKK